MRCNRYKDAADLQQVANALDTGAERLPLMDEVDARV